MPSGRPKKYQKGRILALSFDDKDISFLDDHRGRIPRGQYLIELMYACHDSERIYNLLSDIQELKRKNYELAREKMFLKTELDRARRKTPEIPIQINKATDSEYLIDLYDKYKISERISDNKLEKGLCSWIIARNHPEIDKYVKNPAKLENFFINHHMKNNGKGGL